MAKILMPAMRREIDELEKLIEETRNSGILVIVEGKKDRIALEKLGINNIVELSKKPLFQIVEDVSSSNDECAILTDLDREGKGLFGKLNSQLQANGVRINNKLREFLFRHTKLRQIKGIRTYIEGNKH